ncbi:hypothetical protein WD019_15485 [Fictibacillus sp. Mic-4]|uniref:hypothetical protein n=1 Tax=Fictibacillus sp. Mic-4 TaxID=3132826 RepID=UPI003CFA00B1
MLFQIINIAVTVALGFLSAALGNFLEKPISNMFIIAWSIIVYLLGTTIQILVTANNNLSNELQTVKNNLSSIFLQKRESGINTYDIAIYPSLVNDTLQRGTNRNFKVYINSPIEVDHFPDLEIVTEHLWEIKIAGKVITHNFHAGRYKYFISNNHLVNVLDSKKFFLYDLDIKIDETGIQTFTIIAESRNLKSVINNSIKVV